MKIETSIIGKLLHSGQTVSLKIEQGVITEVEKSDTQVDQWIAPGLIDIQLNGIEGHDLNGFDTTVETVREVVRALHKGGITRFCPTVVTGSKERMLHSIKIISEACKVDPLVDYSVIGIHVEGPFISPDDGPRGAHNRDWVRDPDLQELSEWIDKSENRICKVTLAPERPGAIEFIQKLKENGIVAAIGHCNSSEEDIQKAVDAGATVSTHLGNGAHPYIKRHPNYIWAQLAEDRLWAGLIADGHHLPPSTLKTMIRVKGRKAIITSDAVDLAGMPPGSYKSNINSDVVLESNNFLHLAHTPDILAGSATPLHDCIEYLVKRGICGLEEAIDMATLHPAELFDLEKKGVGRIDPGSPADLILYKYNDKEGFSILKTVSNGSTVYDRGV